MSLFYLNDHPFPTQNIDGKNHEFEAGFAEDFQKISNKKGPRLIGPSFYRAIRLLESLLLLVLLWF